MDRATIERSQSDEAVLDFTARVHTIHNGRIDQQDIGLHQDIPNEKGRLQWIHVPVNNLAWVAVSSDQLISSGHGFDTNGANILPGLFRKTRSGDGPKDHDYESASSLLESRCRYDVGTYHF